MGNLIKLENKNEKKLKRKTWAFIDAYTTPRQPGYLNASESARIAGYSARSCSSTGCNLLKEPKVSQEIEARLKERQDQMRAYADISKEEYIAIARDSLDSIGPKHSNFGKLMEIIGKAKGFFVEVVNNNLLVYTEVPSNEILGPKLSKLRNFAKKIVDSSNTPPSDNS